jgi:S1-C subfamily serine protease
MTDLFRILAEHEIGDKVKLRYYRDGKLFEAEVELFADQRSLMARQYR